MNIGFCSIISKSRLLQGIAMYRSLAKTMNDFKLFVLCADNETFSLLNNMKLDKTIIFNLNEIEDSKLLEIKKERTVNEYCWTLKPVFLSYVLNRYPDIDMVTHVDADLYFFSDPKIIFNEAIDYSVLLTMHLHAVNDDVNSGFVSFKRDPTGLKCLEWWKKKCINWCFFRYEDNKFGDQKYLDRMLTKFKGVHIINTPGVNIAIWNSFRCQFTKVDTNVLANGNLLIFYHFCGLRIINENEYILLYTPEDIPIVYEPYIMELKNLIQEVKNICPNYYVYFDNDISSGFAARRSM